MCITDVTLQFCDVKFTTSPLNNLLQNSTQVKQQISCRQKCRQLNSYKNETLVRLTYLKDYCVQFHPNECQAYRLSCFGFHWGQRLAALIKQRLHSLSDKGHQQWQTLVFTDVNAISARPKLPVGMWKLFLDIQEGYSQSLGNFLHFFIVAITSDFKLV